jgi:hypothetical protein
VNAQSQTTARAQWIDLIDALEINSPITQWLRHRVVADVVRRSRAALRTTNKNVC